jgi:hypothetical protein
MRELMRRCAVASVIEPKLTHSKKESLTDPDLLWVGGYSDVEGDDPRTEQTGDLETTALLKIWQSVLGEAGVETMTDDAAEEFRPHESEYDAPAVPDGASLQSEAVDVAHALGVEQPEPERHVKITHH